MEWIRASWRFALAFLALSAWLPVSSYLQAANLECPATPSNGQPACSVSRDAGGVAPESMNSAHVGNPIDVVSGNKYQSEVDVRYGQSHLSLVRHYNSASASQNIGLGNGWRHTYSVVLSTEGKDVRRIEQSDGRLIIFGRQGDRYMALNESDGHIAETGDNRHVWHTPDGRQLSFYGSFLTHVGFPDGGSLSLLYKAMRLFSVTDEQGGALEFHYAPGKLGLPGYEAAEASSPSGHLVEVTLSDGSAIHYRYSNGQNLVSVDYPRGSAQHQSRRYRYQDALNRALLTERVDGWGRTMARWAFDEYGRAVSYRSRGRINADGSAFGPPDLTLSYSPGARAGEGVTTVDYRQGTSRVYAWTLDESGHVVSLERMNSGLDPSTHSHPQAESQTPAGANTEYLQRYPHDVMTVLDMDSAGYPSILQHVLARNGSVHVLQAEYDQAGRLAEVNWQSGVLEDLNKDQVTTHEELNDFIEKNRFDSDYLEVMLSAVAQKNAVEATARTFLEDADRQLSVGSSITGAELDEGWLSGLSDGFGAGSDRSYKKGSEAGDPDECIDRLRDCASLLRASDYAEVAACAYVAKLCNTRFVEVNLDELGFDLIDLNEASFHAEIFHDVSTGEYIVTFEGTDILSFGDLGASVQQERGKLTFQYEKAVRLARMLTETVPASQIRYVGHSLGGGLATAAAGVAGEAVVFNPAGLTPVAANALQIDFEEASDNTTIYSIGGEILANFQANVGFITEPPGSMNVLREPSFAWIQQHVGQNPSMLYDVRRSYALHGIDAVQQSLADLIDRYQCA